MIERQCLLTRGNSQTVSWLPADLARVGNVLKDGFKVVEVWGSRGAETAQHQTDMSRNPRCK